MVSNSRGSEIMMNKVKKGNVAIKCLPGKRSCLALLFDGRTSCVETVKPSRHFTIWLQAKKIGFLWVNQYEKLISTKSFDYSFPQIKQFLVFRTFNFVTLDIFAIKHLRAYIQHFFCCNYHSILKSLCCVYSDFCKC